MDSHSCLKLVYQNFNNVRFVIKKRVLDLDFQRLISYMVQIKFFLIEKAKTYDQYRPIVCEELHPKGFKRTNRHKLVNLI